MSHILFGTALCVMVAHWPVWLTLPEFVYSRVYMISGFLNGELTGVSWLHF
jgi:hypothetical protein